MRAETPWKDSSQYRGYVERINSEGYFEMRPKADEDFVVPESPSEKLIRILKKYDVLYLIEYQCDQGYLELDYDSEDWTFIKEMLS
jgi:hypothetical protein